MGQRKKGCSRNPLNLLARPEGLIRLLRSLTLRAAPQAALSVGR
jgi:hypothetical protein